MGNNIKAEITVMLAVRYTGPGVEPVPLMYESGDFMDHLLANMAATEVGPGACDHRLSSMTAVVQIAESAPCSNGHVKLLCPAV